MAHAKLSPSAAKRWMVCPGSVALCATIPEAPSSGAADEGTTAHWLAQSALERFRDAVPFTWSTMTGYPCPETNMAVPAEMVGYVRDYVNYCIQLAGTRREHVQIEERLDLSRISKGQFGTADFVVYHPDRKHLDVVDLKYGKGLEVFAEENAQGVSYAIGAAEPYWNEVETISIHIYQPRIKSDADVWTIDRGTLEFWLMRLNAAATATEQPNAPRVVGDDTCRWCAGKQLDPATGKPYCHEYYAEQNNAVVTANAGGIPPQDFPDMESLMAELSRFREAEELIKARVVALTVWAKQQADMWGRETPGYKLVQRRATRRWRDPDELVAVLTYGYGLTEEQIYTRSLLSPAKLEDLRDEEGNKIVARDVVFSYTEKDDNGVELVPVSDKRTAIAPRSIAIPDGLTPFVQNKE